MIAAKLLDLAVSKATLMLGLSAQDTNIQDVFVRAAAQLPASFPTHPPAVMISEDQVGPRQRTLLQNFYRNDYPTQSNAIHAASLVRSYASALLPALWLYVVCAKLLALIDIAIADLPPAEQTDLKRGLQRLRDLAAQSATVGDHEAFMLAALAHVGRAVRLFHRGRAPAGAEGSYAPLTDVGIARTMAAPHLDSGGLVELALGLAIVGHGEHQGHWTCAVSDLTHLKSGAVEITGIGGRSQVFFAGSAHAAAQMFAQGHVSDNDNSVIVHSFEPPDRAARYPKSAPGRTGHVQLREFSISSIKDGAHDLDTLLQRFKTEAAL